MLKTTPLYGGSFGGYLLPHKGFQDAGTFSRLVGTTPLLRGTLTPLLYLRAQMELEDVLGHLKSLNDMICPKNTFLDQ